MAGDWIKFDVTTPDKPEVVRMASILGIDQDAVVGKLLRVWSWADQNSLNGNGVTVTSSFLDRITFCPGFASAMRAVGWLEGDDGSLSLPKFERHNGKTAKERAVTNRRVADHRLRGNGDVTEEVTPPPLQKPLPEKRREEKEQNPPNPPADAGGEKGRVRKPQVTFPTFVEACRSAGEKPIPAEDPIFRFAGDAGIPREFIALAWWEFARKHRASGRRQKDWRAHFRDAVRRNWANLWWIRDGACELTTMGVGIKREREAELERQRIEREQSNAEHAA